MLLKINTLTMMLTMMATTMATMMMIIRSPYDCDYDRGDTYRKNGGYTVADAALGVSGPCARIELFFFRIQSGLQLQPRAPASSSGLWPPASGLWLLVQLPASRFLSLLLAQVRGTGFSLNRRASGP